MTDKYTWENIIFNPKSDEVENIISKECYFGDTPAECLKHANDDTNLGVLEGIVIGTSYPFFKQGVSSGYGCIIVKKHFEVDHVPFSNMEELASTYEETMQGYDPYTFIDNLRCNGMWIRCKEDRGVYQIIGMLADGVIVTGFEKKKTWEELFNEFEFLNKEPCGKIAYTQKSQQ